MLREPLPSEAALLRKAELEAEEQRLQGCVHDPDGVPSVCDEIVELCHSIRALITQQHEKFWQILRVPVTPATAVSCSAAFGAWMNVVPNEAAVGAGLLSMLYSLWRWLGYMEENSYLTQSRVSAWGRVRSLLRHVEDEGALLEMLKDALPLSPSVPEFQLAAEHLSPDLEAVL